MEIILTILASPEFAAFLFTVVVTVGGYIGKLAASFLKSKLSETNLRRLVIIAENAVRVAEQTGLGKTGEEKKAEALRVAQTYLDSFGIKVKAAQLEAAIEAAVFSQLTQFKAADEVIPVPVVETETGTATE